MKEDNFEKEVLRRLDIVISLMLDSTNGENTVTIASKVLRLTELGLTPTEIANIIGKAPNHVTSILNKAKTRSKKEKKNA